ncbi:hypothetical protein MA16_Dca021402 [Dendrobium catenatum]|uniref:Uncharacterized protein n=1 Tax=Dendrobium catenatum TaxID=906689 RepID=A0A2I0WIY5_9ASPA|nr:hypothetical protein MA16_Dca021402 [Dendrobium catenatum]
MRAAFSMVDSDPKKNSKSDTRERVRGDKLSRLDRKDRKNLYLRLNGAGSFGRRQSSAMYGVKIQEVSKKLALWHTPTFSPIMSHDDLEPILCSVGFISPANVPQPSTSTNLNQPSSPSRSPPADVKWKEYAFPSSAAAVSGFFPPRPRLPFPMIWGLHLIAYKAFLSALECYIDPTDVSNLFHVRSVCRFHFYIKVCYLQMLLYWMEEFLVMLSRYIGVNLILLFSDPVFLPVFFSNLL